MSKVWNVWVIVEEIDEKNEDNGKDTTIKKLAKFHNKKQAYKYAEEVR